MTTATATRKKRSGGGSGTTLSADDFKRAVLIASKAVSPRCLRPVLSNLLVGDGVVSGTDLEQRIDVVCDGLDCGKMLLSSGRLKSILNEAIGDEITLIPQESSCVVRIGRGEWRLPTEPVEEFPEWQPADMHWMPAFPAEQFARCVRSVIYAAAKESGRYALHGVLIECIEDTTFFVATDGRRLSLATCKHSESATDDFVRVVKEAGQKKAPIVPVDPLADAVELCLCNPVEEVRMKCGPSAWLCEVAGVTITSKVIEGQFPTWRDVAANHDLPPANTISREALHASTRAAMVVTNDQSRSVQYQFSRSGLVVTAKSSEFGESRIECELDEHAVDAKTNLDPRFVCQFVQPFGKDDEPAVQVHVCPDNGKTVFRIGDSYTGIVMPLAAD